MKLGLPIEDISHSICYLMLRHQLETSGTCHASGLWKDNQNTNYWAVSQLSKKYCSYFEEEIKWVKDFDKCSFV